jgi:hypothetical protein
MRNLNKRVPSPFGEDMEAAWIAQNEAIKRQFETVRPRRSWWRIPIRTVLILCSVVTFLLVCWLHLVSTR